MAGLVSEEEKEEGRKGRIVLSASHAKSPERERERERASANIGAGLETFYVCVYDMVMVCTYLSIYLNIHFLIHLSLHLPMYAAHYTKKKNHRIRHCRRPGQSMLLFLICELD